MDRTTSAAASAVAAADLPLLTTLADHALVQRTDAGRFVLHPLIRQYAGEHLEVAATRADAERRHSEFYLHWLAEQDSLLRSAAQKRALADITQEFPNIRAAWQWAVAHRTLASLQRASFPLFYFLELRNRLRIVAEVLPEEPFEEIYYTCPPLPPTESRPLAWAPLFYLFHRDQLGASQPAGYVFRDWKYNGRKNFAETIYPGLTADLDGASITGDSYLILIHTP